MAPIRRKEKQRSIPQNITELRQVLLPTWTAQWMTGRRPPVEVRLKHRENEIVHIVDMWQPSAPRLMASFFGPSKKTVVMMAYSFLVAMGEIKA